MIFISTIIILADATIAFYVIYAIIAATAIGVGLALRAQATNSAMAQNTDSPQANTVRGGMLPIVFGRRRVGATWLWVGNREVVEEVVATIGGGKDLGGGGGGEVTQKVYFEDAWVGICTGRCDIINGIFRDSKQLANTSFNCGSVGSGSLIDLGTDGSLYIFWGENHGGEGLTLLQAETKINSNFEFCAFVYIKKFRLGAQARWGQVEFDITRMAPAVPPTGWALTLPSLPAGYPAGAVNALLSFDENGLAPTYASATSGWNPAYIIMRILSFGAPEGCGIPCSRLNFKSFNEAAALFTYEGLMTNLLIQQGQNSDDLIGAILEDVGCLLIEIDGKIGIKPIRAGSPKTALTDKDILPPYDEIDRVHRILVPDQMVFTFPSAQRDFAQDTVEIEDDNSNLEFSKRRTRRATITIATNPKVAWAVANRRIQENVAPISKHTLTIMRDFREATIGDIFSHPELGDMRLMELSYDSNSISCVASFLADFYGVGSTYVPPIVIVDGNGGQGGTTPLANDERFLVFEAHKFQILLSNNPSQTELIWCVLRTPKNATTYKALLWKSIDPLALASYKLTNIGCPSAETVDALESDIFLHGLTPRPTGSTATETESEYKNLNNIKIKINTSNQFDFVYQSSILQTFLNEYSIQTNLSKIASYIIINNEIMFFNSFSTDATMTVDGYAYGTEWTLVGVERGRIGTKVISHPKKSSVFFIKSDLAGTTNTYSFGYTPIHTDYTTPITLYNRSQAYANNGTSLPLSTSIASNKKLDWVFLKPIPSAVQSARIGEMVLGAGHGLSITPFNANDEQFDSTQKPLSASFYTGLATDPINNYSLINKSNTMGFITSWQKGVTVTTITPNLQNFLPQQNDPLSFYSGEAIYRTSFCGTYSMKRYRKDEINPTNFSQSTCDGFWHLGNNWYYLPLSAISFSISFRNSADPLTNAGLKSIGTVAVGSGSAAGARAIQIGSVNPKSFFYMVVKVRGYDTAQDKVADPIIIRKEAISSLNNDRYFTLETDSQNTFQNSNNSYCTNHGNVVVVYDRLKHTQDMIKAQEIFKDLSWSIFNSDGTVNSSGVTYQFARYQWNNFNKMDSFLNTNIKSTMLNEICKMWSSLPFIGDMASVTNGSGKDLVWNTMWIEVWEQLEESLVGSTYEDPSQVKNIYSFENSSKLEEHYVVVSAGVPYTIDMKIRTDDPGILIQPTFEREPYFCDNESGVKDALLAPNINPINERDSDDIPFQNQDVNGVVVPIFDLSIYNFGSPIPTKSKDTATNLYGGSF